MSEIKVSVIVPVYNAEKYIEQTLQALIKQTLKEIEIIVINDGSTDHSDAIIKKMAKQSDKVIYVNRENRGVGPTRNEGMAMAKGEYIGFCDSDDIPNKNMYEKMYKAAKEEDADVAVCDENIIKNNIVTNRNHKKLKETVYIKDINSFFEDYYFTKKYENHVWDKIFKRDIIIKNNIKFGDLKRITGEDTFFSITIIPYCKKIIFLEDKLYNYMVRPNSIMNTYNPQKMEKTIRFMEEVKKFEEERKLEGNFLYFLTGYLYNLAIASSKEAIKNNAFKEMKNDIEIMLNSLIVSEYANQLIKINVFKERKKQLFCKLLGKLIVKKKKKSIYTLLRIKYYI